ncbi:energy transducer TonB [Aromatoleum toluolicum]|uniref:Protein TonB n=1 Tax=Aromatoleum toluolicum TaxID=90060 RepID=A0ABX1NM19_9RHOO|nr:energy transducer TonB [Aromatoleum toluolicum]NMG00321.1 energy transducer TonB [Aromatoleum toluolicum]
MAQSHALPSASCAPQLNPSGRRSLSFAPPREPAAPQEAVTARAARRGRRAQPLLLALVVLAHAAGLAGLAQLARQPVAEAETPISVALIELPVPVPTVAPPPPRPVVEPPPKPAPRPQTRAPKPAPKVTEAPTAIRSETPPPQATPEPVRETVAPTPPAPPAAPARPAPEAPPAVIAARFDAAYLNNPAPAYPPLSRRMREEGKVMLRVQVTAEGLPAQVDLAESSGYARLDTAAREAVQRWRFVPAKQGGQPVAAAVIVPIVFKLEGN